MTNRNTVIVCTAGVGFIVFVAGISLGWFGFPAIIVQLVKQVSAAYRTSNSRGYTQRICFYAFISISRDNEIMTAQLGKAILVRRGGGVYRVLVGKPEGRRPLGRPRRRWADNIRSIETSSGRL